MTGISKLADGMGPVSGEKEIEKLVKEAILKMGRKDKPLVLVLDDLQWIDGESDKKLLCKLLEWKPDGGELRFLMTEREDSIASGRLKGVEIEPQNITIRMEEILKESLKLTESAAKEIMRETDGKKEGCLAWLLYGVREFAVAEQLGLLRHGPD